MTKCINIQTTIPGPITQKLIEKETKYLATGTKTLPVAILQGDGLWFTDVDGNTMLDFSNGMVAGTGHSHPQVTKAIQDQATKFLYFNGPDFYYDVQADLAQKLCNLVPMKEHCKVFLSNSGAEGNEAALKISKYFTNRKRFIAFIGSFHGRTMGALSLLGSKAIHKNKFFPMMDGVTHIPYAYCYRCAYKQTYPTCDIWCAKILEDIYFKSVLPAEEVAAVFIEPILGEGGYVVPPKEFIIELKRLSEKYGFLFVDDDVQAGFGRTGKMFSIEHYNVEPDIIVQAKMIASGLAMGATIFKAKYDFPISGAHSNTYGGNPISAVACLATIKVIEEENLIRNAENMGKYFKTGLEKLAKTYEIIGDVRGVGLMLAIELVKNRETKEYAKDFRDNLITTCHKKGLLLLPCAVSGIRFCPALTVTKQELDIALGVLEESIKSIAR